MSCGNSTNQYANNCNCDCANITLPTGSTGAAGADGSNGTDGNDGAAVIDVQSNVVSYSGALVGTTIWTKTFSTDSEKLLTENDAYAIRCNLYASGIKTLYFTLDINGTLIWTTPTIDPSAASIIIDTNLTRVVATDTIGKVVGDVIMHITNGGTTVFGSANVVTLGGILSSAIDFTADTIITVKAWMAAGSTTLQSRSFRVIKFNAG